MTVALKTKAGTSVQDAELVSGESQSGAIPMSVTNYELQFFMSSRT